MFEGKLLLEEKSIEEHRVQRLEAVKIINLKPQAAITDKYCERLERWSNGRRLHCVQKLVPAIFPQTLESTLDEGGKKRFLMIDDLMEKKTLLTKRSKSR